MGYYLTQVTQESNSMSINKGAQQHGERPQHFPHYHFQCVAFFSVGQPQAVPSRLHNGYRSSYLYTT